MRRSGLPAVGCLIVSIALWVLPASAQKTEVSVLYRQESDTSYMAFVPGFTPDGTVDCAAELGNEACSDPRTAGSGPAYLDLTGTTLSLLLPDGRIVVVNCLNKYSFKGTSINRRSCAMPLVERVEAAFSRQSAKLKWPVGPDGKTESENYRIVAFIAKR